MPELSSARAETLQPASVGPTGCSTCYGDGFVVRLDRARYSAPADLSVIEVIRCVCVVTRRTRAHRGGVARDVV